MRWRGRRVAHRPRFSPSSCFPCRSKLRWGKRNAGRHRDPGQIPMQQRQALPSHPILPPGRPARVAANRVAGVFGDLCGAQFILNAMSPTVMWRRLRVRNADRLADPKADNIPSPCARPRPNAPRPTSRWRSTPMTASARWSPLTTLRWQTWTVRRRRSRWRNEGSSRPGSRTRRPSQATRARNSASRSRRWKRRRPAWTHPSVSGRSDGRCGARRQPGVPHPDRGRGVCSARHPLITLVDLSDMWVQFELREDLLREIKVGTRIPRARAGAA